jgi:hypothetical protein
VRALLAYSPALVLLAIGIVVLLSLPLVKPFQCTCLPGPNGTCVYPACPSGVVIDPVGPLLLLSSGIYALVLFAVRRKPPPSTVRLR